MNGALRCITQGAGEFKTLGANCLRVILDYHKVLQIMQKVKKQNRNPCMNAWDTEKAYQSETSRERGLLL